MPTETALMEPRDNGFTFLCVDQTASGVLCSVFFPKKTKQAKAIVTMRYLETRKVKRTSLLIIKLK